MYVSLRVGYAILPADLSLPCAVMAVDERYTAGQYLTANPEWHLADSPWKASQILDALDGWRPATVCEVGCGAGGILAALRDRMPGTRLVGYEIAPDALALAAPSACDRLEFRLQDAATDTETYDLMLIMDVIEHVPDPIGFLVALRSRARRVLLHIPLDLSAQSVLRPGKLLDKRSRVGHIHYFTPETAVATVRDAGYRVTGTTYTRGFERPPASVKARLALLPRRILPAELTVRVLGGYSMLVAAEPLPSA